MHHACVPWHLVITGEAARRERVPGKGRQSRLKTVRDVCAASADHVASCSGPPVHLLEVGAHVQTQRALVILAVPARHFTAGNDTHQPDARSCYGVIAFARARQVHLPILMSLDRELCRVHARNVLLSTRAHT